MELIQSFSVDHTRIVPGIFTSRVDTVGGGTVTTYDVRLTRPNKEPAIDVAAMHSLEHIIATFLRNDAEWKDSVVYFGPMGCRTGFYLVLFGDLTSEAVAPLVKRMFEFVRDYKGEIPGATAHDCGNYLDQNLGMANWLARRYLDNTLSKLDKAHMTYPE